jgi:predicted  nucleic acid-binding Zn-ribbon protein
MIVQLNEEIDELKGLINEQDEEIQMLNNDMYDLRVLTAQEVKEMKTSLFNTR